MATRLKNILNLIDLAPATPTTVPHGLNLGGRPVPPDLILSNPPSGVTITADDENVTVTNNADDPVTVRVLVEHWHSIERPFGATGIPNLVPQPFVAAGAAPVGGGGGGGGDAAWEYVKTVSPQPNARHVVIDGLSKNELWRLQGQLKTDPAEEDPYAFWIMLNENTGANIASLVKYLGESYSGFITGSSGYTRLTADLDFTYVFLLDMQFGMFDVDGNQEFGAVSSISRIGLYGDRWDAGVYAHSSGGVGSALNSIRIETHGSAPFFLVGSFLTLSKLRKA